MFSEPEKIIETAPTVNGEKDDVLILAASWEGRCLGLARNFGDYRADRVVLIQYDTESPKREQNLRELVPLLECASSDMHRLYASHSDSLKNVRQIVEYLESIRLDRLRLSIDISCFTRKHLLQLFHGLDRGGYLHCAQFFYTEAADYDTQDDEPVSQGIRSVRAIDSFMGENYPSRDSLLVLFLGYEGRRALVLHEHLEPNVTIPVIPDPPFRPEWKGRTESQNCYLLSTIRPELIRRTHSLRPAETEDLLVSLIENSVTSSSKYNYRIAPLGTKPQALGVFRFWRRYPGLATVMYASPVKYREDRASNDVGATWLIDRTEDWISRKS